MEKTMILRSGPIPKLKTKGGESLIGINLTEHIWINKSYRKEEFIMTKKRLLQKKYFGMVGLMIIPFLFLLSTPAMEAQSASYKLPSLIDWAAADVGSVLYAIPATVTEKIAPALGSKIRLIPGSDVDRINMMRAGRAYLATMAADTYWATMGLSWYCTFAMGPQPLRIIWAGWPFSAGSTGLATKASGIKSPYDLKGKRVGVNVAAAWSLEGVRANLAWGKLTWNDVTRVEVGTTGALYKALVEGKIDFTMGAANAPGFYEAESSPTGAYLVRYPHDQKEAWAGYRKFMPYHVPGYTTVGATVKPGEKVPTPMYPFPITICLADQSEDFVYAICKAIYSKMDEIVKAYPGNEAMIPERAVSADMTVMAPFHPGAVKLYKEIGRWNPQVEKAQNEALAHLEKVNKRWDAFVDEAQERIAKTKKKVDLEKEWRAILDKEVGLIP
jgi:TRAP transporter TAXI family solute receptor